MSDAIKPPAGRHTIVTRGSRQAIGELVQHNPQGRLIHLQEVVKSRRLGVLAGFAVNDRTRHRSRRRRVDVNKPITSRLFRSKT